MKTLPNYVLQTPKVLYGLALLMFFATVILNNLELWAQYRYSGLDDPMLFNARFRVVYEGLREGIYIASGGVSIQVLIAIWDKFPNQAATDAHVTEAAE